jgi:hypothetical protein
VSDRIEDAACLKIARLINSYFRYYTNSCIVHSNIRMFEHDARCTSREDRHVFSKTLTAFAGVLRTRGDRQSQGSRPQEISKYTDIRGSDRADA